MSTTPDPAPAPEPSPTPEPAAQPAAPKSEPPVESKTPAAAKKSRWPRRLRRITIVLLMLIIAGRFVGVMIFPTVLRKVANVYGLDCTYERLDFSALSGDAGLWYIKFTPKTGGDPILQAEYCRGQVGLFDLLRGRLTVNRLEADGADLLLERHADGTVPLLQILASAIPASTSTTPSKAAPTTRPIDLSPPLRLDALRLTHVNLHLRDRALSTPLDATIALNLRVSDFGSPIRPARVAVDVDADPFLDALHVDSEVHTDGKSVDAALQVNVRGLRLRPLAGYLEPLGIRPIANETTLHATAHLKAGPSPSNPSLLTASIVAEKIAAIADGDEAAACDHFSLDIDSMDTSTIKLGKMMIDGARVVGRRAADGDIRFAGLEILPQSKAAAPATQPVVVSKGPMGASFVLPLISLAEFSMKGGHAAFHDEGISPPVDLAFDAEELSAKNIVFDPAHPDAVVDFSGIFHAPGMMQSAHVAGTIAPFASKKTLAVNVTADGIAPVAVKSYLDAIGIESQLKAAKFACDLTADAALSTDGIDADAVVKNLKFSDATDLIAMDQITLNGLGYRFKPAKVILKDIEIAGPALSVRREPNGALAAVGFRTKSRTVTIAASGGEPAAAQPIAPPSGFVPPAVEIGKFTWNGIHIDYEDQAVSPPLKTALTDAGVEVSDILLGLSATATAPANPGKIHAWAKVPGIAEMLSADGTVTPKPSSVTVDLQLAGKGVTGTIVAPYLKQFGIEPTLRNGMLSARVNVTAEQFQTGMIGASLIVTDAKYSDGDQELAGVDQLAVKSIALSSQGVTLGTIQVERPRISVAREESGAFALAGVRFSPDLLKSSAPASPPVPITATASTGPAPAFATMQLPQIVTELQSVRVHDASVSWRDQAISPAVATALHADVELLNRNKRFELNLKTAVDGSIDEAHVNGQIDPNLQTPSASMNVTATGLRAGPLKPYLPPGAIVSLANGRFQTGFSASADLKNLGGSVLVGDLDYRDAGDKEPLLKVDSAKIAVSKIDWPNRIAIDEISTSGVETSAARVSPQEISLLGLWLSAPPTTAISPAKGQAAASTAPVIAAPVTAAAPVDVATLVAQGRAAAPWVTLNKLDLNLKRLVLRDSTLR